VHARVSKYEGDVDRLLDGWTAPPAPSAWSILRPVRRLVVTEIRWVENSERARSIDAAGPG
jgi:hypothetical protein